MADSTTTPPPAPTEVSVADVAAHYAAVVASAAAHVALIQSKPNLYPGGLPEPLDAMVRQVTFLAANVAKAAPAEPTKAS